MKLTHTRQSISQYIQFVFLLTIRCFMCLIKFVDIRGYTNGYLAYGLGQVPMCFVPKQYRPVWCVCEHRPHWLEFSLWFNLWISLLNRLWYQPDSTPVWSVDSASSALSGHRSWSSLAGSCRRLCRFIFWSNICAKQIVSFYRFLKKCQDNDFKYFCSLPSKRCRIKITGVHTLFKLIGHIASVAQCLLPGIVLAGVRSLHAVRNSPFWSQVEFIRFLLGFLLDFSIRVFL